MRLPETWRTRDGRVLRIRAMSNEHLASASAMLRGKGYLSYREWMNTQPSAPYGMGRMGDMAEYYAETQFSAEWAKWLTKKHHIALDAFAHELAYRRRHKITVVDEGPAAATGNTDG